MTETYDNRRLTEYTVKQQDNTSITTTDNTGFGADPEVIALLPVGKVFQLETRGGSQITGFFIDGQWYARKSDQDLERMHQEFVDNLNARRRDDLDKNREAWQAKEDALPDWLKARIKNFHDKGGERFELDGWPYELCIAELAALYDQEPDLDTDYGHEGEAIHKFAEENGTSGNQHDMAKALARAHRSEPDFDFGKTVSAMSPLGSGAFYDKEV